MYQSHKGGLITDRTLPRHKQCGRTDMTGVTKLLEQRQTIRWKQSLNDYTTDNVDSTSYRVITQDKNLL